jgi:hypothetical protein
MRGLIKPAFRPVVLIMLMQVLQDGKRYGLQNKTNPY